MGPFILTLALAALLLALGEYMIYNLVILLAGVTSSRRTPESFTPPLTVIIPAHNEENHIQQKLENVLSSLYPPESLAVIVVDDGSTDRTAEIVREFESQGVKLLQTGERKGKIYAQKLAFAETSTDIVAITDATVLVPAAGLKKLAAHMADPQVGAVSASIAVRNSDVNYITRVSQFLFDIQNAQKFGESMLDSAAGLFGQMSLIRRDAIGDFSTDVVYEDREFGISLRERGYRARIEPDVIAGYYAPESLADFSKQKKRNVGAMTQSLMRHRGMLFNPKFGWYGMFIFPEYSLFRVLRPYLLAFAFFAALIYCIFFNPGVTVMLLASMVIAVFAYYVLGTGLLAPLMAQPTRFLAEIFLTIPAMAVVAAHLVTGSLKYFRGSSDPRWDRVNRDRGV